MVKILGPEIRFIAFLSDNNNNNYYYYYYV